MISAGSARGGVDAIGSEGPTGIAFRNGPSDSGIDTLGDDDAEPLRLPGRRLGGTWINGDCPGGSASAAIQKKSQ